MDPDPEGPAGSDGALRSFSSRSSCSPTSSGWWSFSNPTRSRSCIKINLRLTGPSTPPVPRQYSPSGAAHEPVYDAALDIAHVRQADILGGLIQEYRLIA